MTIDKRQDFALACRAFEMFSLSDKWRALHVFAGLRYPSIEDRFFEAVHRVIRNNDEAQGAQASTE